MDGFDDLLGPSRNALEANPFADPFAKRSDSPDPWANPFASATTDDSSGFQTSATLEDAYSPPTHHDDYETHTFKEPEPVVSDDPLKLDEEEEEEAPKPAPSKNADDNASVDSPKSPGFRESVDLGTSGFKEVPPSEPEEARSSPLEEAKEASNHTSRVATPTKDSPLQPESPTTPVKFRPSEEHHEEVAPSPPKASSSTAHSSTDFTSPLDYNPIGGLDHSIAGLSLGGDALNNTGWQTDHQAWGGAPAQVDDDSDDDKPIGQTLRLNPDSPNAKLKAKAVDTDENGLPPVFVITVDDPQKVGDPIRGYMLYTVHTRTTSPLYQKSAFSVLRRYSDFLWLYETLSNNNPGVVVPPVPEKNTFGRFDDQFVRQRRMALEKCIQKMANHPVLSKDTDLKLFLESDTFSLDIKHRKAEIAHERGGLMASIGQAVVGPRFHETDEWFDKQKGYLDSLESQLKGLVKAIEVVAKQRAEVATATGEFAQSVTDLAAADVGKHLSQSLTGLADVEKKAQDLQSIQGEQDMVTLLATVDEYSRLINSVRLAFAGRIRTYHNWKQSESDLLRMKQSHEKDRAQNRIPADRLGYSLSRIAEAERRALDCKHEYEHVSKLVKSEMARFEQERIQDLKDSLHAFLEGMIARQKELIGGWENYQHALLKRAGGGGPPPAQS